ncbi:MAG: hypothetical protein ACYC3X_15305 [Pirellulaceae bacterium]
MAVAALIGLALVGLVLVGLRTAVRSVPDFYAHAVAIPAAAQQEVGASLERNVLALHNESHGTAAWSAVFTDEQINGWLAADLPEKFPQLLPPEIQDPRVAFWPNQIQLAGNFSSRQLTSVVSVSLEVRLADEPNTLAVRILGARAGLVPLPLKQFVDEITAAAQRVDLPLQWAQVDGDPVALITLVDLSPLDDRQRPRLERVEVRAGELYLAGRTERRGSGGTSTSPSPETTASPR